MFDNSLSLTAFKDGKKGSAAINHFDDESIASVADSCMAAAEASAPDENWEIGPDAGYKFFEDGVTEPDMELFFKRCRELVETV
ncbi:MAG: TldD/PmbA family protein, partial [Oscillospiraceae bacterium]|nr:TldD/PmbA family protein [Oscillospiraceae bacterium]